MAADTIDLKTLTTQFATASDKLKEIAEEALAEAEKSPGMATETKAKAAELLTGCNGDKTALDARIGEIEQRVARGAQHGGGADEVKTLGDIVTENDEIKALMASGSRSRSRASVSVDLKTVLSATGTWGATTSVGT